MIHLRDCYVELGAHDRSCRAYDAPLVFERFAGRDEQLEPTDPNEHSRTRLPGDLLDLEGLDDVSLLDVLEVLETDAALEPLGHFASVVLEAL
jgi:hypothetical protein